MGPALTQRRATPATSTFFATVHRACDAWLIEDRDLATVYLHMLIASYVSGGVDELFLT